MGVCVCVGGGGGGAGKTVEETVGGSRDDKFNTHFTQFPSLTCIGWTQRGF